MEGCAARGHTLLYFYSVQVRMHCINVISRGIERVMRIARWWREAGSERRCRYWPIGILRFRGVGPCAL